MTYARLTSAKCFLTRNSVLLTSICVMGVLTLIALPSSKTQMRYPNVVDGNKNGLSTGVQSASFIRPTNVSVEQHRLRDSKRVSNHANQRQASLHYVGGNSKPKSDITIIPKIEVFVSAPHLWADGQTPAVIHISLTAVNGNETWNYASQEELVFQLEPRNVLFDPARVKIAPGATTSEPATLTAKQPLRLQVTCTPDRKYEGLAITKAQPENIEFITPIDAIGIEPVSGTCPVNVAMPFEIFLYNKKDPQKTRLPPRNPISIQVVSESGNGNIAKQPVPLTEQELSRFVDYVGTKTGGDTIKAIASYEGYRIEGRSDRKIVFPLWLFMSGVAGSLLGSGVRYFKAEPSERNMMVFFESLFYGVVVCIIMIIYPIGTKFPQITNFIQPLLIFVLVALVSFYGPQSLYWALSFIPKPGGQANG